ncbi:MAG: cysteine desulfurase [Spirochaetales bacterium]|nr:cysteine desulfurase [Spirochaetales bacterium]
MSRVYLDWAATAPPDPEILDSVSATATRCFANPSAIHASAREAAALLEEDRRKLASLLGCLPQEIIFTSGGTESNNMVIFSLLQPGTAAVAGTPLGTPPQAAAGRSAPRILLSAVEHASVYNPATALRRYGYDVTMVPASPDGRVDPRRVAAGIDEQTRLVALMLVNNETGAVQPVAEVSAALRELRRRSGRTVHLHCDAVQAFGKIPVRPEELEVDSLSISAHKIGGPRGVGALYLRRNARADFLYVGGGQEGARRPGTENLPGIHGLVLSAERACGSMEHNLRQVEALMERLLRGLQEVEGAVLVPTSRPANGRDYSPYILNVAFPPVPGEVLVRVLEEEGYAISTGSACSSRKKDRFRVHEGMGIDSRVAFSAVRVSLGPSTRPEDIDGLLSAFARRLPELLRVASR